MIAPTPDEYEAWRVHPVTEVMIAGLKGRAALQREAWEVAAWEGQLSPVEHAKCRARAEAYAELADLSYADLLGIAGLDPPPIKPAETA